MNIEQCVNSLSTPLPEDILKRKWAGDLEGAVKAIDLRLEEELPQMLRDRLICEKERIRRLPTQYPWDRKTALLKLQELAPKATSEDFNRLELAGWVDFIYIGGEKRYFVRFHRSLLKAGLLRDVTGEKPKPENDWLDPMIAQLREKGSLTRRITLDVSLSVDQEAFVPGEYLVHLPFPAVSAQQSDIELISGDPDGVGAERAPARTLWWRRRLEAWRPFSVRYSYTSRIRYADPLHREAPVEALYPGEEPPREEDLSERGAYLRFTPYLRALAAELTKDESGDVGKAWKIYEFVTTKVKYAFVRDYFQFDDHGEYCAVNLKGDCGLQALLFIILCRISGIPARWQSGMAVETDYTGAHDWAQFYLKGWGWLFADCSYGGSAYRAGNSIRHQFYFGNLEPMRMVANRQYQAELEPKKQALRADPFDNQSGEMERAGAPLPFTFRQLDCDAALVSCQEL